MECDSESQSESEKVRMAKRKTTQKVQKPSPPLDANQHNTFWG